jgi:hypothetical protein
MKKTVLFCLLLCISMSLNAKNPNSKNHLPANLYEQLCQVNQEWYQNQAIAEKLGFTQMPIINDEQELLVFHLQTLEKIFLNKDSQHLNFAQENNRKRHLAILNEYWNRRDCPKNTYLPYRNPVFIDAQNRHCAVAYLMQKDGKTAFCKNVRENSNFIFVRNIKSDEFEKWQAESGLSLDELAWIQPGYMTRVEYTEWNNSRLAPNFLGLDTTNAQRLELIRNKDPYFNYFMNIFMFQSYSKEIIEERTGLKNLDWTPFEGTNDENELNLVASFTMYRNELYISYGKFTNMATSDSTSIRKSHFKILKWGENKKWEKVYEISNKGGIYCFFENGGKLYMGGGNSEWTMEGKYYNKSLLIAYDGKTFKDISPNYDRIISGLCKYKSKIYLETVVLNN